MQKAGLVSRGTSAEDGRDAQEILQACADRRMDVLFVIGAGSGGVGGAGRANGEGAPRIWRTLSTRASGVNGLPMKGRPEVVTSATL